MREINKALQWAQSDLLTAKNVHVISHEKVTHTTYSIVYKINTENDVVYLKQVPRELFLEARILSFFGKQGFKHIPELIGQNDELNCFVMRSAGDQSLRQIFNGKIDINPLKQGIINYTKIQRRLEDKARQLLSLGAHDWQLNQFSEKYRELIEDERLLLNDGVTQDELKALHQLSPKCISLCEDLAQYQIPETLNHCDFHENNMLYDNQTGNINIIDWGEVAITHPFFSLCGFLWNVRHFYHVTESDSIYQALKLSCIKPWLDLYSEKILLDCLDIADKLNGVFAALAYAHLYKVTQYQDKSVAKEHHGAIAGCLRTFLRVH